jgi:hypothetical protein
LESFHEEKTNDWERRFAMKWGEFLTRGLFLTLLVAALTVSAGPKPAFSADFDRFIMPVSNPVYSGDARNHTILRPMYMYQNLPEKVATSDGKIALDGHVNIAAFAVNYAFTERFSFVAVKDGWVDCEPRHTLNDHHGWADLAAGLQYSFLYRPEKDYILSGRLVYEAPTGSDQVYQGNGDGNIAPSILFLKGYDKLQFSGTLGFVIPFDKNDENTLFYDAWHLSYAVTNWLIPLVELNHFYVINPGDRKAPSSGYGAIGTSQEDDLVAGIAKFNGCDLINLGGDNNDRNRNLVTLAMGARFRVTEWLDFGAVYELPLSDESKGMIEDRVQVDAVVTLKF